MHHMFKELIISKLLQLKENTPLMECFVVFSTTFTTFFWWTFFFFLFTLYLFQQTSINMKICIMILTSEVI